MANPDDLKTLQQGVDAWNASRDQFEFIHPDLSGANLSGANLSGAKLGGANLFGTNLSGANLKRVDLRGATLHTTNLAETSLSGASLRRADLSQAELTDAELSGADLRGANLSGAKLGGADLFGANLSGATLMRAYLFGAKLSRANLSRADLSGADLGGADLSGADLSRANLFRANLFGADLSVADLSGADLSYTSLVDADITKADLTGCHIYGVSAWGLKLSDETSQRNLIITRARDESEITVDNIEVAQFIYLLLHNQKIRDVIDTITSKVVLILGRFTDERKAVLDVLRDELRKRDYLPILFDFEKPGSRTTDETITLLARIARFVIADISDAKSVLQELRAIVPELPSVPVQPVIIASQAEPGMFDFHRHFPSFLPVHRYDTSAQLLTELSDRVIERAEAKALEFRATHFPTSLDLQRDARDPQRRAASATPAGRTARSSGVGGATT